MVTIQNQSGRNPTRWDKTGVVIETKPHDQVVVKESQISLHFLAVLHDYHNTNASNQLYCDIESIINIVMSPISFFDLQERAQISGKPANRHSHARGDCRTAIHQFINVNAMLAITIVT